MSMMVIRGWDAGIREQWPAWIKDTKRRYMERAGYHTCAFTRDHRVEDTFKGHLPEIHGRILDMGCSDGTTTTELSGLYPDSQVIGIDIVPPVDGLNRFHWKREEKRGNYVVADGYLPPLRDGSFDAVFCMNNIYFDAAPEARHSLPRLVKEGGYLLISGTERRFGGHDTILIFQKMHGVLSPARIEVREDEDVDMATCRLEKLLKLFSGA